MKKILLFGLVAAVSAFAGPLRWEFRRDGGTWEPVRVPHDWAIAGPFDKEIDKQIVAIEQNCEKVATEKTGRTGALPWIGSGEYRTRLVIPEGTGFASLVFDGVMSEPEVFFDGQKVGEWKYGYNAFEVELPTEPGEHEVRVTARNRPESSRWYPGAGIIRPVRLVLGNATGVKTWGQAVACPDLRTVKVTTDCRGNPAKIAYRILDGDTVVAASETGELKGDFTPWSPENPKLYTLVTEVYAGDGTLADRVTERIGVRTLAYGDGKFLLNGKPRKFKGVCLHHDLGPLGAAFERDAFVRQVTLLKEMGCDAIRTAHNMPADEQLAVCDELGVMVMAESFDSWRAAKVANGYNRFFDDWWRRDLKNLVFKCRNHPSVVMWSIGNEISEQTRPDVGVRLSEEMQTLCHALDPDPGRKVTQGLSWMPQAIDSGVNGAMDIPGVTYRLPFYEAMYKATKTGLVLGAETASTVSSRGEYFFPVVPTNAPAHANLQCSGYDVEWCPWSNLPDDDWAMQEDKPWTIGEFVWTGFDYLGEPTPYDDAWPSRSSYFGIFDLAGLPKDRYWLYRSHWQTKDHTLHLLPHWTFPGREGQVTPVYCYTDFDEAELFINGRSQGRRKKDKSSRLDRFRLRWNDVVYEPGELKVVAFGKDGKPALTNIVRTAGAPVRVELEKRRFGKLLFVTATLVDAAGTQVPNADRMLAFSCGEGLRFRAICNGDATSVESFVKPQMRTFHGQLVAIFEGEGDEVACRERPEGELQEKAQELADYAVSQGLQGALQFCAFKDGKCIVDVWAGTMTTNAGATKVDGHTLFPIFSTEKPLLATGVHRTVEQGKLGYDDKVSTVWPEFRGGGKENLTVRELLGYRSGLPDGNAGFSPEGNRVMSDWKAMLDWYASVAPDIIPGTKQRYMAKSYGWAHGGLLEKVWKQPANAVLREQVLIPAGIENDFYFMCGDKEIPRIATVYKSGAFESMNDDLARRSFLPSAWAVSSARGLAQFYNRLCGFDGRPPLLKKETLDEALMPCRHPSDPVPDAEGLKKWHMIFGMGYGLWGEAEDLSRVFGHGGVGGSEGLCDRSQRIVVGYTCNFDQAPPKLREAFYSLVGIRWRYWSQDVNIQDLQMATMKPGASETSTQSVASFCKRAEAGERLTVAFHGGSLTWGANATDPNRKSWRALIGEKLEARYPKAHFKFIDAAIGGTGSELGIFRLDRDVIAYRPDLLIIEWSCNDGIDGANDNSSCSYEGIVRRYLAACPKGVVAQVIIPTKETVLREDESTLKRRTERIKFGKTYNLATSDLLGELRIRHRKGLLDLEAMWPAEIGDMTHPFDPGYALYADVIWEQLFAQPSAAVATVPEKSVFRDKYRHVVRRRLSEAKTLPDGWRNGVCSMRAGTFDFLCSRWQDGVTVATNATPLKATFRGEVLLLFGESTEKSGAAEVWVDGRKIAAQDCSLFGKAFAPSAYLQWPLGGGFDGTKEHSLEIRPVLKPGEELRIESICVAGEDTASVDFKD